VTEIDPKELAQKALKQIRHLCDGNGTSADSVQIMEAKGEIISMEALTHLELDIDTSTEERAGKYQQGTFLPTVEAMQAAILKAQQGIIKNDQSRQFVADKMLKRPDQGFASHGEEIPLNELKQDFSCHTPCGKCQGEGQSTCQQCGGHRKETCTQCHGRTLIPCRNCGGNGMMQGQDGKQHQCKFCFGKRQVSCPLCQKTGRMNCRKCRASGHIKCDPCKGGGVFTQIVSVLPIVKTLFEMDRAELPHPAVYAIENMGTKLAAKGHMTIQAEQAARKDGGLAIKYNSTFPYGNITFSVNGKPVKANIFGNKAKLLKLKPFLEDLIAPAIVNLNKAANNDGVVANQIKKASGHRLVGKAILYAATMPKKKALMALKKQYPMGISNQALQNLIKTADRAIGNVTRKPRYVGLGIGLISATALYAGLFLTKGYQTIVTALGNPSLEIALAAVLMAFGGGLAHFTIKLMAKRSMTHAIGNLLPKNGKVNIPAKTRTSGIYAYIGAAALFLMIIEVARQTGAITPSWYFLK
jgi:hypothetical protein